MQGGERLTLTLIENCFANIKEVHGIATR